MLETLFLSDNKRPWAEIKKDLDVYAACLTRGKNGDLILRRKVPKKAWPAVNRILERIGRKRVQRLSRHMQPH